MKMYKGRYFFLDEKNKRVLQYNDKCKYINSFGKFGEGPGEFSELYGFDFVKDQIYLQSRSKIVFFSLEGKLIKEIRKPRYSHFLILKNGNLIESFLEYNAGNKHGLTVEKLYLCSSEFKRLKLLLEDSEIVKPGMPFKDFINKIEIKYSVGSGEIIVSQRNKGFLFHVFDDNGKLLFKIKNSDSEKIKVTEKFVKDFKGKLLSDPRMRSNLEMAKQLMKHIKFSEYFPPFHSFYPDENGNIFIRTFKRKAKLLLYKKYSSQGNFCGNLWIKDENPDIYETRNFITFFNNEFFYMNEDDNGDYTIVIRKL